MPHHHFPKLHCSNNDVILSNTYGHQPLPLSRYDISASSYPTLIHPHVLIFCKRLHLKLPEAVRKCISKCFSNYLQMYKIARWMESVSNEPVWLLALKDQCSFCLKKSYFAAAFTQLLSKCYFKQIFLNNYVSSQILCKWKIANSSLF